MRPSEQELAALPLGRRLAVRTGYLLTREWLLWTLVAVFWVRLAVLVAVPHDRPDGANDLASARALLYHPAGMYDALAESLRRTGYMTFGWSAPPGGLFPLLPFAALPPRIGLELWTLSDGLALIGGLVFIAAAAKAGEWRRPFLFLIAGFFPAVFADIDAGQVGGWILLFSAASIWLGGRGSTFAAGLLGGVGSAIKLYPAALVFGQAPRRFPRFVVGLAASALVITALGFLRYGGGVASYVSNVLLPTLHARFTDCEVVSPSTLVARTVGGDRYPFINDRGGLTWVQSPLHFTVAAQVITGMLLVVLVVVVVVAAARSGWHLVYGPALGFALGALIPREINVYQMLPLLPVVLIVAARAAQLRRYGVLIALAIPMLVFLRQPCYLPFPDLWSVASLALFAICAWNNGLFLDADQSAGGVAHGAQ